jgi:hypothetical protein
VNLDHGSIDVRRQYSRGAWAELKTENARRTLPLPTVVRDELRARYAALNGNVVRIGRDDRTVFTAPEGGPLDYKNFRDRVWAPLLERTAPDAAHPNRPAVTGCCAYATVDSGRREREDGANTHGSSQRCVHDGPVRRRLARGAQQRG